MRLLCVSHPCVVAANQEFYARVEARSDWQITIVLPARWRNEFGSIEASRWHAFKGDLAPTRVVGAGRVPLHVYATSFSRRIAAERPDAVYVHNEPYALATFQVAQAMGKKSQTPFGFYSAQNIAKAYSWPISAWERYVHRRATFALPISPSAEQTLRSRGYMGVAEVLPLGVPVDRFVRRDPGTRSGPLVLGYVGRLTPEKGVDTLLDALATLPAHTARALVAGDGPAAHSLRKRAIALGLEHRVEWLGYVPHERAGGLYPSLDALVVPSRTTTHWSEQFGRVVIEAMACGVPVVASDSGALPDLVARTGGGWTFREGDPASLADRIRALADGERFELRRRGSAGHEAVVRDFGLDGLADRFAAAVSSAVRRSRRST